MKNFIFCTVNDAMVQWLKLLQNFTQVEVKFTAISNPACDVESFQRWEPMIIVPTGNDELIFSGQAFHQRQSSLSSLSSSISSVAIFQRNGA